MSWMAFGTSFGGCSYEIVLKDQGCTFQIICVGIGRDVCAVHCWFWAARLENYRATFQKMAPRGILVFSWRWRKRMLDNLLERPAQIRIVTFIRSHINVMELYWMFGRWLGH